MPISEGVVNNLQRYENDAVYLNHQSKTHIFPVDKVYHEENVPFEPNSYIDKKIFDNHISQNIEMWLHESMNIWIFTGGQTFSGKEECLFGDRLK